MCFINSTPSCCNHPECRSFLAVPIAQLSPATLQILSSSTLETGNYLRELVQNNLKIPGLLSRFLTSLDQIPEPTEGKKAEELPQGVTNDLVLNPDSHYFLHTLDIISDFPEEIVKNEGFRLRFCVRRRDGRLATGLRGLKFRVMLYTNDSHPLNFSIAGRRAMRGTVDAVCGDNAEVEFTNVLVGKDQGRLTVVMDLVRPMQDETLCHTFIPSDHAGFQYQPDVKEDGMIQVKEKKTLIYVYKRPNLDQLLEKLDKEYEPVVYSTGTAEYTNQVLDVIDPKGIFRHRLSQEHCVYERVWSYPQYEFMKDIRRLRGDMRRMVVIDDDWQGMYKQPDNFVWVDKFEAFYQDDSFLKEIPEVLEELKNLPDVRPYLRAKYMLKYAWAANNQLFQLTSQDEELADYLLNMDLKDYPQLRSKYYQVFGLEKKLLLPSELW